MGSGCVIHDERQQIVTTSRPALPELRGNTGIHLMLDVALIVLYYIIN